MAILQIDENSWALNIIMGVLETYKPSKKHRDLQDRMETLRVRRQALVNSYNKVFNEEIKPELEEIQEKVKLINEETYPQLKDFKKIKKEVTEARNEKVTKIERKK